MALDELDDEKDPNYAAARRAFLSTTAYWPPEWVNDRDMFTKMLDSVLEAANEPEGAPPDIG